jgi:hypothetical protein
MADFFGSTFAAAKSGTLPQQQPASGFCNGKRRSHTEIFTFAGQAAGSTLYLGTLPIGAIFEDVVVTTSVTTGTTTLSVGTKASPAKYTAAQAYTVVDSPTGAAKTSAKAQGMLATPDDVFATTAVGALPGAGTMVVELRYKTAA